MPAPATAGPSWLVALRYRLISRLIHHPRLLRLLAAALRSKPSIARIARIVAGRDAVAAVFHRQHSFCTAHAPNLRAGEFVIGMTASRRQQEDREFLTAVLPSPERFGAASAVESRERIKALKDRGPATFDMIDYYMVHVVWRALRRAFGPSGIAIAESPSVAPDLPSRNFVEEVRALGAQLIIGSVAPERVRSDADRRGSELNGRVKDARPALGRWWSVEDPAKKDFVERNAVGMLWVAHPATVQAGALCMQELFERRAVLASLSQHAQSLGDRVWSDAGFRQLLSDHVLELLRFRPPFPILVRDVPRDTWFDVDRGVPPASAPAGSQVTILPIGALFDRDAMEPGSQDADAYQPGRKFRNPEDRLLMFGLGERSCIAKDQVVAMLVSALSGLLTLPELRYAGSWLSRIAYDGPTIKSMRLRFGR